MNRATSQLERTGHRSLIVWEKAVQLAADVTRLARLLPPPERYSFALQLRSAAISIGANIAEGKGRSTRGDYARFLVIARGSARELDTYFEVIRRLGYVRNAQLAPAEQLVREILRMLTAMLRKLTPLKACARP